jgi:hypothetical protein
MQGAKTRVASTCQEKLPAQKRAQHRGAPVIFKHAPQTIRIGAAFKSVRFGVMNDQSDEIAKLKKRVRDLENALAEIQDANADLEENNSKLEAEVKMLKFKIKAML